MKSMKRMLSVLLSVVMAVGLMAPAFAADTYTITINNANKDYQYEAYQVFAGTLKLETKTVGEGEAAKTVTTKTLSDISWGSGVKDKDTDNSAALLKALQDSSAFNKVVDGKTVNIFAKCETAADVAKALADNNSAEFAAAFADVVGQYLTDTKKTSTYITAKENHTITGLAAGYYFVKNTADEVPDVDSSYTEYILQVVADVTVEHKGDIPSVEKKIVEDYGKVDHNEAAIGEVVNYEITGTMPENIADYNTYFYKFSDTLSKGLTFNDTPDPSIKVEVVNYTWVEKDGKKTKTEASRVDVTDYFYTNVGTYSENDGTDIVVSIQDVKALTKLTTPTVKIDKDTEIVVTYSAILNEKAVVADVDGNPNTVKLIYSNDPNHSGVPPYEPPEPPTTPPTPDPNQPTGETPEDMVKTYTTQLTITKVDENGRPLKGAEFTLVSDKLIKIVVKTETTFEVDNTNGTYYKLANGTYTTTAPVKDPDDSVKDTTKYYDADNIDNKFKATTTTTTQTATETDTDGVYSVKAEVDDSGKVTFTGLAAGTYTLKETKTPDGYNTMPDKTIVISYAIDTDTDTEDDWGNFTSEDVTEVNTTDDIFITTIVNYPGSVLPETGGIGTTLFYIFGGAMVIGAAVLMVTKRRVNG
ncbi:MAG: isopeptide-forming domain-containing fimbrial protein [Ruminiclostridium sp.]|nr:isopeptide-forming domain-containing fimbrial protein [Ruminiclostridium sp.]